jgi:hypothetical protein
VLVALLFARAAEAHGPSMSHAELEVEGDRARLTVTFAAHDLVAALGELDRDRDGLLRATELGVSGAKLLAHVAEATALSPAAAAPRPCRPEHPELTPVGDPVEEVQVALRLACAAPLDALHLRLGYLPALEPPHATMLTARRGEEVRQHVFGPAEPELRLTFSEPGPRAPPLALALLGLGAAALGLALARRRAQLRRSPPPAPGARSAP